MQEIWEFFKYFTPIVAFGLGVWAAPLIEARKEKAKARSVHKNLLLEIDDELDELRKKLVKMAGVLESLKSIKAVLPEIGTASKYVPKSTSLYFLKLATEVSFSLFNKDQRCAIKSLFAQISFLDRYLQAISDTKVSHQTIDECIANTKRYLYTASCMFNTMCIVANKPKADLSGVDEKIIETIFSDLDIKLKIEDLKIVFTEQFETAG